MIKIHEIGNYALRNYLLETDIGWIAIDTGYPGGCEAFVKRFEMLAPITELKYIILTHAHDDHAGFLAELLDLCAARVVMHPLAPAVLKSGQNPMPEGAGYSSRVASLFGVFKKDFAFPPVEMESRYILTGGQQVFRQLGIPVDIINLPGHTADSIGVYLAETKELFCGDAAMNAIISVKRHTIWIDSIVEFQASWDKMIAMASARIYPSHGNSFMSEDLVRFRHYLDGRKLIVP